MPSHAKTTRPVLTRVLHRERLLRALQEALAAHPIAWIGAPAGSGKTVLAEALAAARGGPCLWYQLDARDADPTFFFYYLRAAIGRLVPRKRETLPLLTPAHALSLEAYVRDFFEALGGRLRPGTLVVLDDYHEVPEEASIQRLLPAALASLPESIRVVVASRAAPPPPFARLVAHRQIARVGPEELNLTEDEIEALARVQRTPQFGAKGAAVMRRQTGGWFAGTILLLARESGATGERGTHATGHEVLFDYFASEIFDRAPATVRRFLLETAVLPNVSVAAAERITGDEGAAEILAGLVRRNYFTVRRAGAEPVYQYHPLFRTFLLARARRAFPVDRWSELASRAIDALLQGGAVEDAAALMIDARDHARLAGLAVQQAPALAWQGRLATVQRWLRALPEGVRAADPWLEFWLGVSLSHASPAEARAHLERAYDRFKACGDAEGRYAAWAAIVRTFLVVWDRFDPLDPWIDEFTELRRVHPELSSVELEAVVTRGITSCLMWRQPGHPEMEYWAERCAALLRPGVAPETQIELAMSASFYLQWFKGDVAAHARILDATRPLLDSPGVPPLVTLLWHVNEASYRGRLGDRDACYAAVERCFATIADSGLDLFRLTASLQAIYGALATGDVAGARRYHEEARGWLRRGDTSGPAYHAYVGFWIALCEGDFGRAEKELRGAHGRVGSTGAEFARTWVALGLAHVLIEQGRTDEAIADLEACIAWSRSSRSPLVEHHCALSIAYALLRSDREAEAVAALRPAMALGRAHEFTVFPWIGWRRDVMSRLCALALEHGIEAEHVRAQIRASRLRPPAAPPDPWPYDVRIRALGGFEVRREQQRLSPDGRSNRKPLELLQAIVALGGSEVREDALAEALWPDADGDAAQHALETNLYRLRKLVGAGAVVQRGRRLSLDPATCWVDTLALERSAARVVAWFTRSPGGRATAGTRAPSDEALHGEIDRLARLYRGPFLSGSGDDLPWATPARERFRRVLTRVVAALEGAAGAGSSAAAAQLAERLAQVDAAFASAEPGAMRARS